MADFSVEIIAACEQVAVLQPGVHRKPLAILHSLALCQTILVGGDAEEGADDDALAGSGNIADLQDIIAVIARILIQVRAYLCPSRQCPREYEEYSIRNVLSTHPASTRTEREMQRAINLLEDRAR